MEKNHSSVKLNVKVFNSVFDGTGNLFGNNSPNQLRVGSLVRVSNTFITPHDPPKTIQPRTFTLVK